MKKKLFIVIIIIGVLMICAGIMINKPEQQLNPPVDNPGGAPQKPGGTGQVGGDIEDVKTEEVVENEINDFANSLIKDDITIEKIKTMTNSSVDVMFVFYGKESYMRTINDLGVKNVPEYDKKLDELAKELDEAVKDNFEFELTDYIVSEEGDVIQRNRFKTFYYVLYIYDYIELKNGLLKYSDFPKDAFDRELTEEETKKMYMINVKAFEIMNEHLDNYVNENEYSSFETIYKKGGTGIYSNLYSLLIHLAGNFYKNVSPTNAEEEQALTAARTTRINSYISEAISSGQLDTSNPYKLK